MIAKSFTATCLVIAANAYYPDSRMTENSIPNTNYPKLHDDFYISQSA